MSSPPNFNPSQAEILSEMVTRRVLKVSNVFESKQSLL